MPAAKHEANRRPVSHNVEARIEDFRIFVVLALRNISILFILVCLLWSCIEIVPSTLSTPSPLRWIIAVPSTLSIPFPLRWALIAVIYLGILARNAEPFILILGMTQKHIDDMEDKKRSQDQDLGRHTTSLEDWFLAHFCIVAALSTIGFVAWYWMKVIALTGRTFFYWTCTMAGLFLLFWLIKRAIRFYKDAKGVKNEQLWSILIAVNVLRVYEKFQGLKAKGVFEELLDVVRLPAVPNNGLTLHRPLTR